MTDAVERAVEAVDEDFFVLRPDGSFVPQSSSAEVIARLLRWLEVPAGATVLEIGTGSGYSTALLSHVVGPEGRVVSVDVDASLVERARGLLRESGVDNALVVAADGAAGAPGHGPFDRVIAWATPQVIPIAWSEQARPGAIVVTPVQLTALAHTEGTVRVRVGEDGRVSGEGVTPGGFAPLYPEVVRQWALPVRGVDAVHAPEEGDPWWLSAEWLRETGADRHGERLLSVLRGEAGGTAGDGADEAGGAPSPLSAEEMSHEALNALFAFLLARRHEGLTTASLGDRTWWVGCTRPGGAALLCRLDPQWVAVGEPAAAEALDSWIADWRRAGRPGWDELRPEVRRVEEGWQVRVALGRDRAPLTELRVAGRGPSPGWGGSCRSGRGR